MSHPVSSSNPAIFRAAEVDQFRANYWEKRFNLRHPSPHPAIAVLDVEYNELAKAWRRLEELLPLPDQVLFEKRPQTSKDVQVLVRDLQAVWASSPQQQLFSHSMTLCDVFLATLDSHTVPLNVLPSHDWDSTLFYSTLQCIIRASSGYPRIMNGVMKALAKVNQSICLPEQSEPLQLTGDSMPSVANFYAHVFFLLGELMDWYARRFKCRLLQSLHEDVYLDFSYLISTIQNNARGFMHAFVDAGDLSDSDHEMTDAIMQHTGLYLWEEARLSQIGRRDSDRRFAAQNAWTRLLIWEIQRSAERRSKLRERRNLLLLQMFNAASQRSQSVADQSRTTVCLTAAPAQGLLVATTTAEKQKHKYSRVELQSASAHLQAHFDNDDQLAGYNPSLELTMENNVVESLRQWATDTYSQILAIGGLPDTSSASPAALISACYANLARDAKTPIIAHFCSLPPTAKDGMTLFQQGLIALVYSLIRQLLEYLPPVLNGTSTHTIKAEKFTLLDGTLASWKEVLSLIDILLYYSPPFLLCIVDGLDRLHDVSTDDYIRSLVRVFVSHTRGPSESTPTRESVLLKILFTVSGPIESLVKTFSESPLPLSESSGTTPNTPLCSDVEITDA
ncbi:hypothetical protein BJX76DRAFT_346805 [Aspergillus varians]